MSGLLLTGAFTLTQSPIEAVGDSMDLTITSAVAEVNRPDGASPFSFTYYIDVDYDINPHVIHVPSSSVNNQDDSYGLNPFNVSSGAYTPKLKLPTATGIPVDAGLIIASAGSGLDGSGHFPVTLRVTLSDQGVMTSSCSISGQEVEASVQDDATKAQVVHWPTLSGTPLVESTTADKLSDTITVDDLTSKYSAQLADINGQYHNKNMISAWTIAIDGVTPETNNSLSKYAQDKGKAGIQNIFESGQKIVCSQSKEYSVSIEGYDGNTKEIASGIIYGVITQV